MKEIKRQHRSFRSALKNINIGTIAILFLCAVAFMAFPASTTQASAGTEGGDVYEPPVVGQGGDCIDGSIIDIYHVARGEGWKITIKDSANAAIDTVVADADGLFHFPSQDWLTNNDPALGYPAGIYSVTLEVPAEGWQPFTPITFTVTLNGSADVGCAKVRFKVEALAKLCVTKQDVNGTMGLGTIGIPGWEFKVFNETGDIRTAKTNGLGMACFPNLPPDVWTVQEEDIVGWQPAGFDINPKVITLVSPRNPGNIQYLNFTNRQVHDACILVEKKDDSGNPMNGVTMTLTRPDGTRAPLAHATGYSGTGIVLFCGLPLGEWTVTETPPASPWWNTTSANPQKVTLTTPGETQMVTFINEPLGCVDGYKINSLDAGLPGWKITAQKGDISQTAKTDANGYFKFYLSLGTWTISEEVLNGWTPVTSTTFEVPVTRTGVCEHVRFKNATKYACVDVYKKDYFGGIGLPGWTISLQAAYYTGTNAPLSGVTDGTGWYRFNGLTPGVYYIWETQQVGWTPVYVIPGPSADNASTQVTLEASGKCTVVEFYNMQTRFHQALLDP